MRDNDVMQTPFIIAATLCSLLLLGMPAAFADEVTRQQALSAMKINVPQKILSAPAFDLPGLQSASIRLSDFKGKLVLLNFWASFCAPCRKEMPALENIWQHYREQGLVVLALSADRDNLKEVGRFIKEGGYSFPVLLDTEGEARAKYEIRALPTSYLIGRDGKFIGRIIGERDWASNEGYKLIEVLLSQ
ncbi:Thiol:disulfide oxidoreductase related to ResA [hydrothermal vent metagenome]|uniref:Thiol:disulfide oxidoreductase related to ResA n=1 Tax=hydrothermal vent metagenome TaxID=652676 RepID=A0A3B1BEM9_9ZZZZ